MSKLLIFIHTVSWLRKALINGLFTGLSDKGVIYLPPEWREGFPLRDLTRSPSLPYWLVRLATWCLRDLQYTISTTNIIFKWDILLSLWKLNPKKKFWDSKEPSNQHQHDPHSYNSHAPERFLLSTFFWITTQLLSDWNNFSLTNLFSCHKVLPWFEGIVNKTR